MNMHGLALFQFVRNVVLDVQSYLHGIELVGLSPMVARSFVTFLSPFRVQHVSVLASNKQCVTLNFKVLKCYQANWILDCFSSYYMCKSK